MANYKMNQDTIKKYPKTSKVIMEAFAGESQARNKYDFFAKVAKKEGHQKLADFFEETARNEQQHAKLLFKLLNGISNTQDNLKVCIEGENYEHTTMYPDFAKIAKQEGFKEAEELFNKIAKVEIEHENRFKTLLSKLENNTLYRSDNNEPIAWICRVCGNVETAIEPPEKCPVCNHPKGYFEKQTTI